MQNLFKWPRALISTLLLLIVYPLSADESLENFSGEFIKKITRIEGMKNDGANAMCIDGDILYCGAGRFIYALDTSTDPQKPMVLSSVEIYGLVRQMTVQDGILYAACRESGAWIIDVSDPKNIKIITRYDTVELATGVEVAGDVLFLGTRQNGVECVDVSDPANPVHIRMEKTHESQSVTYRDGILYSGEWGAHCISVIDASDMANLKTLKTVNLQGHGDGVWTYGNYLYAATGHHLSDKSMPFKERLGNGHGVEIFDISVPTDPKFVSRIGFDHCYVRANDFWTPRPCSGGNYVVVADTYNGLYVVDARDRENLSILSKLSFTRPSDGKAAAVTSLAIGKGVIYISVSNGCGFYALECPDVYPDVKSKGTPPVNAGFRYDYPTSKLSKFRAWKPESQAPVRGVAVKDDILYAACSYGGLAILRQGKKGNVEFLGSGPIKFAGDVKVCGDLLWVAEGFEGLAVYRIGEGTSLTFISRYTWFFKDGPNAVCQWVFTPTDTMVAVGTRTGEYYYLDVSDLQKIRYKGYLGMGPGWDKYLSNRADSKGWYPATRHKVGIMWINLNEEKLQEIKDNSLVPNLTDGVCLFRDDTFLTCCGGAIYVYNSDLNAYKFGTGNEFYGMPTWDGGKKLALTYRINKQISMADVKAGVEPLLLWTEKTSGYPETPAFWNGKLAVPCGYQGLLVEK